MKFIINDNTVVEFNEGCWKLRELDSKRVVGYYTTAEGALGRAHDLYLGQKRVKGKLEAIYEKYTKEFFEKVKVAVDVDGN